MWLPLKWSALPEGTKELAIFIDRFKYTGKGGDRKLVVPYADLIGQIKPSVRKLATNVLPEGVSWSNVGSVTCPTSAKGQRALIEIFALDRRRPERQLSRALAIQLTQEALADRPTAKSRSSDPLIEDAVATGRLITTFPTSH